MEATRIHSTSMSLGGCSALLTEMYSFTMAGRFARWLDECFALFLGQAGLARRTVTDGVALAPVYSIGLCDRSAHEKIRLRELV